MTTAAPLNLRHFPATLLAGFPFRAAEQLLTSATRCTPKEAELALGECTLHPRPLNAVARDRFKDIYLQFGADSTATEFVRYDAYARAVAATGALIEVEYQGRTWTCEVHEAGTHPLWAL